MAGAIGPVSSECELRYLLLGCTGKGKSATGNSILGTNGFETGSNVTSETILVKTEWAKHENLDVQVIDGPGLMDTEYAKNRQFENELFMSNLHLALFLCQDGFHAILITLRYGERLTPEQIETLDIIKAVLGVDAVEKYGIIVFTHGDNFADARNIDDGDINNEFKRYMKEQKEKSKEIKSLLNLVNNRFIIFDNSRRAPKEIILSQRIALFNLTKNLNKKNKNKSFDCEIFLQARLLRKDIILKTEKEAWILETEKELSMVLCFLTGINKKLRENKRLDDYEKKIFFELKDKLVDTLKYHNSSNEYLTKIKNFFHESESCLRRILDENKKIPTDIQNKLKECEQLIRTEREKARAVLAKKREDLINVKQYQDLKLKLLKWVGYGEYAELESKSIAKERENIEIEQALLSLDTVDLKKK